MVPVPVPRAERTAFLLAAGAVFVYVVLRALQVPIVHDEAMTFFLYVDTGRFLPFLAHWDAANHLLCTALGWASVQLFGVHLFALRLPSVLAFLLYAFYVHRWAGRLHGPVVRWCFRAVMLGLPFLLDFFSLFRGYGLSMTFWLMALYELSALLARPSARGVAATLLSMAAAAYSGLSLVSLWAMVLAVVALLAWHRRKWSFGLVWFFLGLPPFLFAAYYMSRLSALGSLYYGLETGVWGGTVPSLLQVMVGHGGLVPVVLVALAYGATVLAAVQALRLRRRTFSAWVLMAGGAMLLADGVGRVVLHAWNGTPYPEDRTALQWAPLFLLLLFFTLDGAAAHTGTVKWVALLLLALPLRTVAHANLSTTVYWPEQAIPGEVFRAAEEQQRGSPHLLTIGAYHQMQACWGFGLRQRGVHLNAVDWSAFPDGGQDLLLTDPARMEPPAGYRTLVTGRGGRVALSMRGDRPKLDLVLDSLIEMPHGEGEFVEFWHPPMEQVRGHAFRVELELEAHADRPPLTGSLVVEVNAGGRPWHRDDALVQCMRNTADPDSLVTVRAIPVVPADVDRLVVYYWAWNPNVQGFSGSGRLRVYRVAHD